MKRRQFLTGAGLLLAAPGLVLAGEGTVDYTPGLIKEKLAAGETVFVDFAANWCGTCARQERVIEALRANNMEFDKQISFVRVDWDTYSSHEITARYKVPRRSTLILLRGDEELGRIVAGTSESEIEALMSLGLSNT